MNLESANIRVQLDWQNVYTHEAKDKLLVMFSQFDWLYLLFFNLVTANLWVCVGGDLCELYAQIHQDQCVEHKSDQGSAYSLVGFQPAVVELHWGTKFVDLSKAVKHLLLCFVRLEMKRDFKVYFFKL